MNDLVGTVLPQGLTSRYLVPLTARPKPRPDTNPRRRFAYLLRSFQRRQQIGAFDVADPPHSGHFTTSSFFVIAALLFGEISLSGSLGVSGRSAAFPLFIKGWATFFNSDNGRWGL
jgi:hypothetical protein